MLLDYTNGRIALLESPGENFLNIQDKSPFALCHRMDKGHYTIPYVALPIIIKACKDCGYSVAYTKELIDVHKRRVSTREMLEQIKQGNFPKTSEIEEIKDSVDRIQSDFGFKLQADQLTTVIYGIVGKRVVIANDIGTGKTLVANTIATYLLRSGRIKKVLVMLPASLTKNYLEDYKKFFGPEGILLASSQTRPKRQEIYRRFRNSEAIRFLIVNYEKCNFDYEELQITRPEMLVVDEFHIMKNFLSAQRSINFFKMLEEDWDVKYRYPMSGSPIENRLFDLFPIFKLVDTGYILGGQKFFSINFVEYKKKCFRLPGGRLKTEEIPSGLKNTKFLNSLIRPLIIRKKLSLPYGKYETDVLITPSKELKETYESLKQKYEGSAVRYHAARQFLCDTRREGIANNPKLELLLDILDQSSDSKIVIFSFYKCTMAYLAEVFTERGIPFLECSGRTTEDPFTTVQRFKEGNYKCLIATDRVNFGHNIQIAKYLINWEYTIKPTTQLQRIGRLYRTGVQHDIHVYNFVVENTVEEKIYENYMEKKDIILKVVEEMNDKKIEELEKGIERSIMREFE